MPTHNRIRSLKQTTIISTYMCGSVGVCEWERFFFFLHSNKFIVELVTAAFDSKSSSCCKYVCVLNAMKHVTRQCVNFLHSIFYRKTNTFNAI